MTPERTPASEAGDGRAAAEAMRAAMADYIAAVHRAYLEATIALSPGERGRLPLIRAGEFTVAAVGARNLHVIGTQDGLPAPAGPEVALGGEEGDLRWTVRFFDPVVLPALGLIDDTAPGSAERIRDLLGLSGIVYHLTVPPGGGLSAHHALHAGTGLAHSHAAASRDYETLLGLLPTSAALLREMRAAEAAGLSASTLLLARAISPEDPSLAALSIEVSTAEQARRLLLAATRGRA